MTVLERVDCIMGNVQMENLIQRSLLYTRGSASETNTAFDHNGGERGFHILENLIKLKCSKNAAKMQQTLHFKRIQSLDAELYDDIFRCELART